MTAEQKNSLCSSADEETQRAIRRMQAAGLHGEEARRAAALDLAIRRTMDWPRVSRNSMPWFVKPICGAVINPSVEGELHATTETGVPVEGGTPAGAVTRHPRSR